MQRQQQSAFAHWRQSSLCHKTEPNQPQKILELTKVISTKPITNIPDSEKWRGFSPPRARWENHFKLLPFNLQIPGSQLNFSVSCVTESKTELLSFTLRQAISVPENSPYEPCWTLIGKELLAYLQGPDELGTLNRTTPWWLMGWLCSSLTIKCIINS